MKDAVSLEDRTFLNAIRGTFTQTKKEKIRSLIYACLFLIGCPVVLTICILSKGSPHFPLSTDQWIIVSLILGSIVLGEVIRRLSGFSYIFDGNTVRQIDRSGCVWKEIPIRDTVAITVDRSRATVSMLLRSERSAMGVLLTPDLRREINRVAGNKDLV